MMRMAGLSDSLFWDVVEVVDSSVTALQYAAFYPEYRSNSTMGKATLRIITNQWHEPEHINAQVAGGEFKGRTAMHFAALTANVGAVRYLLDEEKETVDLTLLDSNNFSILDMAAWGLVSQESRIKLWGELPSRVHIAVDMDHWERAMETLTLLLNAGAKPHKIAMAVTRIEDDKIHVFDLETPAFITIGFGKPAVSLKALDRVPDPG
jgi:hypothetical protein